MLVEMNVTNFRSFSDKQTLSLVKGTGDEREKSNTFTVESVNNLALLRSAAIYGPNAGGKSNFLLAIRAMRQIVRESATSWHRGDALPVTPFKLSSQTREEPSEFEVTFLVEGVRYQYGFSATAEQIHEEWLFAYPKGRAQRWFARAWNCDTKKFEWRFGNSLSGEKQLWQKSTRDNALFLSTAVQLNSQQLKPVYDWFNRTLRMGKVGGWSAKFSASLCENDKKSEVIEFMHAADIDIADVLIKERKGKIMPGINTVHIDSDGEQIIFDFFNEESDGTQKLFAFAGPWITSLKKGYILFIDELHLHLHPKLVKYLVELFHNPKTNPHNAQLVFTTHETSILNQEVFRRDQIWFCEKNESYATELYPLTDFHPRKGRDNLELAYLSGRYGAVPFVKTIETN